MEPGLGLVRAGARSAWAHMNSHRTEAQRGKSSDCSLYGSCLLLFGLAFQELLFPVFVGHHALLGLHLCQQQGLGAQLCPEPQETGTDAEQGDPGR